MHEYYQLGCRSCTWDQSAAAAVPQGVLCCGVAPEWHAFVASAMHDMVH
jgi:hypothetical protein